MGFLVVVLGGLQAYGQDAPVLPRFVSLASSKVYVRVGPDKTYRVAWEFKRRSVPVEVTLEYDSWRKIRDCDGAQGWVHKSMLTGIRHVIFLAGRHPILDKPKDDGKIIAYAEGDAIARLKAYDEKWCEIEAGLYPNEERSPTKCFLGLSFFCRKAATK